MTRQRIIVLLFMICHLNFTGQEQTEINAIPFESVILQTDREIYIPGETIWLKADYLASDLKSLHDFSKVIYVELTSLSGEVIEKNKFHIKNGMAEGSIGITEGLSSAYYVLRAYTRYQRNFPASQFAKKVITIINPAVPLSGYEPQTDTIIKFALLNNVKDKTEIKSIACKLYPGLIKNLQSAKIINQYDDTISEVNIAGNGLGGFSLPNSDSLEFKMLLRFQSGFVYEEPIPPFKDDMLQLGTEFKDNKLFCKVFSDKPDINENGKSYELRFFQKGQEILDKKAIKEDNSWHEIANLKKISYHELIYIVLRDDLNEVKIVKTLLKPLPDPMKLTVSATRRTFSPRESIKISINNKANAEIVADRLSIAVVKNGTGNLPKELPVYVVENPQLLADFLKPVHHNANIKEQANILMALFGEQLKSNDELMKELQSNDLSVKWIPEIRGLTISGIVKEKGSSQVTSGIDVYIATIGEHPQLHIYNTNSKGEFIATLNHADKLNSVFLCIRHENEEEMEILVNSDYSNESISYNYVPLIVDTSAGSFIKSMNINAQLSQQLDGYYADSAYQSFSRPIGFAKPKKTILLDDYIPLPTLQDVFNELVTYVKVRKKDDKYQLEVFDDKIQITYDEPLVLLDNLPVFDMDELLNIDPKLILSISVINSTIVYGDHILKGIVSVKSNTENFAGIELPYSSTFLEFNGLADDEDVSLPDYTSSFHANKRLPDFRNTLYWNPDLNLIDGQVSINFPASDHRSVYDVFVHGFTKEGAVVKGYTQIEVK